MTTLVFLAGVCFLGPPTATGERPAAAQQPADDVHAIEMEIVEKTNRERVRYGLRPLILHRPLLFSARRHCAWMCNTGAFQHTTAPVAENIAMGQANAEQAMSSWMNSSGHRANILNASYSKIGVSAYRRGNGQIYWVQQFTP